MKKHGTFSGKQNVLERKLRANPGCSTELPRGSCPWWEFCGCNCAATIVRVQLTQVEIVQRLISLVEISQMVVVWQLTVQRTIVLDVSCPEGICPGRLIIWGEIVRGGQLSCHPFYVILTFSFVVRIEAGDCKFLRTPFLTEHLRWLLLMIQ